MLSERSRGVLDDERRLALLHCVLCHHGPASAPGGRFASTEALALYRLNARRRGDQGRAGARARRRLRRRPSPATPRAVPPARAVRVQARGCGRASHADTTERTTRNPTVARCGVRIGADWRTARTLSAGPQACALHRAAGSDAPHASERRTVRALSPTRHPSSRSRVGRARTTERGDARARIGCVVKQPRGAAPWRSRSGQTSPAPGATWASAGSRPRWSSSSTATT